MSCFQSVSDDYALSSSQQVRVHFAQTCSLPGSHSDYVEFSQMLSAEPSVASVADVSGDTVAGLSGILNVLTNYYIAIINPNDGYQAGDIRANTLDALSKLNQQKAVPCSNFTVGLIEADASQGGGILPTSCATTKGTIALVALAAIAVVVLFLVRGEGFR